METTPSSAGRDEFEWRVNSFNLDGPYAIGMKSYWAGLAMVLLGLPLLFIAFCMDWIPNKSSSIQSFLEMNAILFLVLESLGVLCLALGAINFLIFMYRCWNIVQDGRARHTPGAAIGFLFIPLLQNFWALVAFRGLVAELDRVTLQYGLRVKPASHSLGSAIGVYHLLALVPICGVVTTVLNLVLFPFFIRSVYHTIIAMRTQLSETDNGTSVEEPVVQSSSGYAGPALVLAPLALGLFGWGIVMGTFAILDNVFRNRPIADRRPMDIASLILGTVLLLLVGGMVYLTCRSPSDSKS